MSRIFVELLMLADFLVIRPVGHSNAMSIFRSRLSKLGDYTDFAQEISTMR